MAQAPILTLSNLTLGFGQTALFKGLNAVIHSGDRLCLIGRNGSGKSTLLKVIAGLLEPDDGTRFLQPGMAVTYLEQNPNFDGFATLGDYAQSCVAESDHYKIEILAEGLKLNPHQNPAIASGGEKRRAALLAALARDSELLLLDEPTNHLDIEAVEWLQSHLKSTKQAYLLISHDRAFLRDLTHGSMWIDRGEVRQISRGFAHFEDWRDKTYAEEDLHRHKQARLIKAEAKWAVEGISARRKRNQGRVNRLQALKADRASYVRRKGTADMALADAANSGKKVIDARGVSFSYGTLKIIENFDLKLQKGDRLALVGANGVGKTSLIKLLTGDIQPDKGTIKQGTNLIPVYFDQNREGLIDDTTLWENLVNDPALGVIGKSDHVMVRGEPRHVIGYLKQFLFEEAQARGPISKLSGGERARLLLAKLMAKESNLLVLDEPTNDLDIETLDLLQECLDEYQGTVILVSHDRDFIDRVATHSILMEGNAKNTAYAGGWSDIIAQGGGFIKRDEKAQKPVKKQKAKKESTSQKNNGLSYSARHRLDALPDEIDRITDEIAKLETFLATPNLYSEEPLKFEKATNGLLERQEKLSILEEEWMSLMEKEENST